MAPRHRALQRIVALRRAAPWLLLATAAGASAVPAAAQPAPTAAPTAPASTNPRAKGLTVKGAPSTSAAPVPPGTPATTGVAAPATPPTAAGAAPPPPAATPQRLSDAPPERLSPLCRSAATKRLQQHRRKLKLTPDEEAELADFNAMHLECFNAAKASLTSGGAGVGEEILRSVAQVVLNRAQRSAWKVLQQKLLDAASCDAAQPPTRFPATCKVLGSLAISDLASSPSVLTRALVTDLLPLIAPPDSRPWMKVPFLDEGLKEATQRWRESGISGLQSGFAQVLRKQIKEQVAKEECDQATSALDKASWVSGMCLIETQAPPSFMDCDVDGWVSQCTDPVTEARIRRLWTIAGSLFASQGKPKLSDYVDFFCTAADIAVDENGLLKPEQRAQAHDYVSALRSTLAGLANKDWIETTSGSVRALRLVAKSAGSCADGDAAADCQEDRRTEKLFTLLAAVGNYAETFTTDAKDAGTAREKILEDLVDRMVDRTHRDSGFVVSAGGNLGLIGGARTDFSTGAQVAFPAQLGLGVGLQSYSTGNHGFHAMATAVDLGQYVSFSGSSLKVDSPALESSVTLGLTVGAWLGLRETPYYIGAYGGVSPFVKAQDKPTYQLGLVTGIYLPLLDFN